LEYPDKDEFSDPYERFTYGIRPFSNGDIGFFPMAEGPDVIKFDPGLGRIYVACYSGAISVFHQDDPDHYRKLKDFKVQHAVHSLAVDPETHRVYAPEQEENGKPVARMVVYEAVTGQ
jgi:hypothetical protein